MKLSLPILAGLLPLLVWGQSPDATLISQDLRWRNIGPANMMGRIAAVDALQSDYRQVLCASASGGVFKSSNGGITWEAIFDESGGPGSIGAVKMHQGDPDVIWVGTGEAANRNSTGWGDGIYRSIDGGKTFSHLGLEETHHIAEIALHPNDIEVAWVAAPGHLWGHSGQLGLFKTTNGGATWAKVQGGLPDDGRTGCTEIILHPNDPSIMFAAFYERLRTPYWYESGGLNGGIYKSVDGGQNWRKITRGLAEGPSGMIDLSICLKYPNHMVAAYEADEHIPEGQPGSGVYKSEDGGESWTFLLKHAVRPFYHGQIEIDPSHPDTIYVVSRDFRISYDGGQTFQRRSWRADGGDDHDMWIAPYDSEIMYLCTDQGLRLTVDGGRSILSFNNMAIGQYYAIGVDMRDPYWVVGGLQDNGLWMGPSNSREVRGILNGHNTWVGEGDGFHSQIDPSDWRTAYLVNHVGFATRLDLETREHTYITPTPETVINFQDHFDPDFPDSMITYTIYPGEHWFYGEAMRRPLLPPQFRFNWSSPLVISPTNAHTIYFGGNYLFRSTDRGDHWKIISPDLTGNDPARRNPSRSGGLTNSVTGGENHFTIITISPSPLDPDEIWIGTDDGQVQLTRDGGTTWTNVRTAMPGIPDEIWVSRVEASKHQLGRCYITLDNHRYDDMTAYVMVTEDHGKSWTDISANLPDQWSTYVVKEDYEAADLLFVGNEIGAYASLDRGQSWIVLDQGMPKVAVHDLVIHPRDGDLVAGTHGRSIWILDDISALRQMSMRDVGSPLHLFESRRATDWQSIYTGRKQPYFEFRGENPEPGACIQFWLDLPGIDSLAIEVSDPIHGRTTTWQVPAKQGLNRIYWNLRYPTPQAYIEQSSEALGRTLRDLETRVTDAQMQLDLEQHLIEQARIRTVEDYNELREKVVAQFAGYATGKNYFGAKITEVTASPGWHQVSVRAGADTVAGRLQVRADPLLK